MSRREFETGGIERNFSAHKIRIDLLTEEATALEQSKITHAKSGGHPMLPDEEIQEILADTVKGMVGVGELHNDQEEEYEKLSARQEEMYEPLRQLKEVYSSQYTAKPEGSHTEYLLLTNEESRILARKKSLSEELDKSNNNIVGSQKRRRHTPGME